MSQALTGINSSMPEAGALDARRVRDQLNWLIAYRASAMLLLRALNQFWSALALCLEPVTYDSVVKEF